MADFTRFEFNAGNIPHTMTITGEHSTDIDYSWKLAGLMVFIHQA
jgi:hypothetical protein